MGIVQSNISKKDKNDINIPGNTKRQTDIIVNMNDNSTKFNISTPLNTNYKFLTKNKTPFKSKNTINKINSQKYDPNRNLNGNVGVITSTKNNNFQEETKNQFVSEFRWTLSSEFDQDLVSSFERLEPLKSISYEKLVPNNLMSFERLRPFSRIGSDLANTLKNATAPSRAYCQGFNDNFSQMAYKPQNESTFIPNKVKNDEMNLDAPSSRTTSTDISDESMSTKRQAMDNYDVHMSNTTAYVSTTVTTNATNASDEPSEKRSTIVTDINTRYLPQEQEEQLGVYDKHERKVEFHERNVELKRDAHEATVNEHKISCMPTCFRANGKNEKDLIDKPSYNSLCTKCMHKEDKIPKGFKGMIIQLKSHKSENKVQDKSPYLNRSNIVLQKALVDGKRIEDVYELNNDKLGKGSYGNVLKGVHKQTGSMRAVKIIRKSKIENAMRMKREIQIMKTLDHPNIIKLFEVYEDLECLYLVMEMCTGGELFDRIVSKGSFSENYAAFIIRQVFSAIAYCHSKNILHRDLKPENILYSNNSNNSTVKIIDWGFATKCFRSHKFSSLVGTPYYVAPEVLMGNYDKACDIWSAGVILFILLVGYPPFHGSDNAEILKNVKRGCIKFIPKHWSHVSKSAMDLITRCLSYIPKNRITAEEALNHEWILKCTTIPPTVAPNVSKSLARRFKNFLRYNKMKQMALTCIAYHLSEKELAPLNSAFEALDRDGDGMLSLDEVASGLESSNQPESNINQIVKGLDTDQSGAIEYTEFIAASIDTRLYDQNDFCARAFNIFDTDGDGKITREDMFRVFAGESTSVRLTHEMVDEILNEVDMDKDGTINYKEFYAMLYGLPEAIKNLE